MMTRKLLLLLAIIPLFGNAQIDFYTQEYDWEKSPTLYEIPEDLREEPEIVVKETYITEFGYSTDGNFKEIRLTHRIVHINTDDAIEENNKIYLMVSSGNSILDQKARVIKANGKIVEMSKDDVKVAKDEATERTYEYFAIDDLAIGDQIETLNRIEYSPNYTGLMRYIQSTTPKLNYTLKIIAPKHLEFAYKGYNGFPGFENDTSSYAEKVALSVEIPRINKFKEETGSYYEANFMKVVYKLEANKSNGKKNLVAYSDVAGRIYTNYVETSKSDMKIIKKIAKKIDLPTGSDEDKVRAIENYIKYNYSVTDESYDALRSFEFIYQNKLGNGPGMARLFAGLFNYFGLKYEMVFTTDRSEDKFEAEFDAYCFLQEILIYFPSFNLYLNPNDKFETMGYLAPEFTYNNGLFIEELNISGIKAGIGRIDRIPFLTSEKTVDLLKLDIDLTDGFDDVLYKLHKEMTGYYAAATQPYYTLLDDENLKEMNESHVKYIGENIEVKTVTAQNTEWGDFGKKPLIVDAEFTSDEFFEKAGNKYLFKVGLLIGPQMELYAEEERTLPVEQDYCRKYQRYISFTLPEGYTVGNLNDAFISKKYTIEGQELMAFVSTATQVGNTITIEITEYYDELAVPVSEYEMYRQVINAAADFNKVVLVLEQL